MYRYYVNSHRWRPTREQWLRVRRCLPRAELERIEQYAFQRDVKFTVLGQLLIRSLLTRAFQQRSNSSSFDIQRTPSNRPFVPAVPSFDFNLSHHHQLVCIAGTFDGRVGCDTMVHRTREPIKHDHKALARKIFTADERQFLASQPTDETIRSSVFYRLWCLKESYVKWLGQGVQFSVSRLNFRIRTDGFEREQLVVSDTQLQIDSQPAEASLRFDEQCVSLPDGDQQLITLCLSIGNPRQAFVELTIDDLLRECTPFDDRRDDDDDDGAWQRFQTKTLS